jgi:carbon monoxide dehydrogenase subunit G
MPRFTSQGLAGVVFVTAVLNVPDACQATDDVVVRVQKSGGGLDVYAELTVAASAEQAWGVLVDYDHMAQILSSVDVSRIVKRDGNLLEVVQTSHIGFGPLKISLDNRRRVALIPQREIRSHLIEGDLKTSDFMTRLVPRAAATQVIWRGRIVPGPLASLAVTPGAVEAEVGQLCRELRAEILRRQEWPVPRACGLADACR